MASFEMTPDGTAHHVRYAMAKTPTKERKCAVCGGTMRWIPHKDRFGRLYSWRPWCDDHGHAKRKANT
jgi:hypothetical protein